MAKYKNPNPINPIITPETEVKYNLPVTPKTGINEANTVHNVYNTACNAVLLSRFPFGNIKKPAFL